MRFLSRRRRPDPRLQRTRLRSPLSRKPFGAFGRSLFLCALATGCHASSTGPPVSRPTDASERASEALPIALIPSGIALQADREAVVRVLGPPAVERSQVYDTWRYDYGDMIVLDYPGIRFRLVGGVHRSGAFRVLEIEIATPIWTVTPGLYIGMHLEEAQRRLPSLKEGTDVRSLGEKVLIYTFNVPHTQAGGKLLLVLNRKKVVSQIILTSDLD